jgi:hypothetical protein
MAKAKKEGKKKRNSLNLAKKLNLIKSNAEKIKAIELSSNQSI